MNESYLRRIEEAYQGEVYGEAMYLAIAAAMTDPDRAYKWRVLAQQETETREHMRTVVARHAGDTAEHAHSRDKGNSDASKYAAMPWDQLMRKFSRELDACIAAYAELESGCPPEDAAALRRLTEHEVLTKRFCDIEIEGQGENSIQAVVDFCSTPPAR